MKKILLILVVVLFSISSVCFAEDVVEDTVTTEEATTTTLSLRTKTITLPWAFRFNRFLLNVRKAITTDSVAKLNIDGEILFREAKIISEYQALGKIEKEGLMVQNYLRRKESLINRIDLIKKQDDRIESLIDKVISDPVISEERQGKLIEILSNRQDRLGIQNDFLQERARIIEERKNMMEQMKEERKGIVDQIKELPRNFEGNKEAIKVERKELLNELKEGKIMDLEKMQQFREQGREAIKIERKELLDELKEVKNVGLEKMQQFREQGREAIERKKEEIQNIQKPARPIRQMQNALDDIIDPENQ